MSLRIRSVLPVALSVLVLCLLWEIVGLTHALGPEFPALSTVAVELFSPQQAALFGGAIAATAVSAGLGLLIGGGSAILFAALRQSFGRTRPGLDRLAATIHAVPQIAIAPVFIIIFGRDATPAVVASIGAFFPAYAAATAAFASAAPVSQDLFTVFGSSRLQRFRRLEVPSALPNLMNALRLAAPGAVIGSVLGEWFGAPQGVGLLILTGSQNYNIPLLWAAAVIATALAMAAYLVFTALQQMSMRRFS